MSNRVIYSYKLANYLISKGNQLNSIKPHKKKIGLLVFHFKESNNLDKDVTDFTQQYSKQDNSKGELYDTEVCKSTQ